MKICYLADATSVHTINWLQFFSQKGHDIYLITDTENPIDHVTTINVGECLVKPNIPFLSATIQIAEKVRRIKKHLSKIKPDILHAHYATNYGVLAALSHFHPYILTLHGSDLLVDYNKDWISQIFVKIAVTRADIITSASHYLTKVLQSTGLRTKEVCTFQYGIDIKKFFPLERVKRNLGKTVVSTRYLIPKYRADVLIDAISLVIKRIPDVKFVIVGDGELRKKFIEKIKNLGLENQVEFLGNISHDHIPDVLRKADVYVSTSPSDGLSVSLLEAMACGLFPIVTDIPANRLLIENGKNGLLFPVGNAERLAENICTALEKPDSWRSDILENIKTIQRRWNRDDNLGLMEEIYKNVLRKY
ncbi:glycosyltransferase [candidate division KSB1 bacterium]|nr:glycosyltransferase [candidate division KSB1 bacterium]